MGLKTDVFHFFEVRNDTFLMKWPPKSPPFEQKFAFLPIGSSSRHSQLYFEPKILGVGSKLSLQWTLKVTRFTFLKCRTTPF